MKSMSVDISAKPEKDSIGSKCDELDPLEFNLLSSFSGWIREMNVLDESLSSSCLKQKWQDSHLNLSKQRHGRRLELPSRIREEKSEKILASFRLGREHLEWARKIACANPRGCTMLHLFFGSDKESDTNSSVSSPPSQFSTQQKNSNLIRARIETCPPITGRNPQDLPLIGFTRVSDLLSPEDKVSTLSFGSTVQTYENDRARVHEKVRITRDDKGLVDAFLWKRRWTELMNLCQEFGGVVFPNDEVMNRLELYCEFTAANRAVTGEHIACMNGRISKNLLADVVLINLTEYFLPHVLAELTSCYTACTGNKRKPNDLAASITSSGDICACCEEFFSAESHYAMLRLLYRTIFDTVAPIASGCDSIIHIEMPFFNEQEIKAEPATTPFSFFSTSPDGLEHLSFHAVDSSTKLLVIGSTTGGPNGNVHTVVKHIRSLLEDGILKRTTFITKRDPRDDMIVRATDVLEIYLQDGTPLLAPPLLSKLRHLEAVFNVLVRLIPAPNGRYDSYILGWLPEDVHSAGSIHLMEQNNVPKPDCNSPVRSLCLLPEMVHPAFATAAKLFNAVMSGKSHASAGFRKILRSYNADLVQEAICEKVTEKKIGSSDVERAAAFLRLPKSTKVRAKKWVLKIRGRWTEEQIMAAVKCYGEQLIDGAIDFYSTPLYFSQLVALNHHFCELSSPRYESSCLSQLSDYVRNGCLSAHNNSNSNNNSNNNKSNNKNTANNSSTECCSIWDRLREKHQIFLEEKDLFVYATYHGRELERFISKNVDKSIKKSLINFERLEFQRERTIINTELLSVSCPFSKYFNFVWDQDLQSELQLLHYTFEPISIFAYDRKIRFDIIEDGKDAGSSCFRSASEHPAKTYRHKLRNSVVQNPLSKLRRSLYRDNFMSGLDEFFSPISPELIATFYILFSVRQPRKRMSESVKIDQDLSNTATVEEESDFDEDSDIMSRKSDDTHVMIDGIIGPPPGLSIPVCPKPAKYITLSQLKPVTIRSDMFLHLPSHKVDSRVLKCLDSLACSNTPTQSRKNPVTYTSARYFGIDYNDSKTLNFKKHQSLLKQLGCVMEKETGWVVRLSAGCHSFCKKWPYGCIHELRMVNTLCTIMKALHSEKKAADKLYILTSDFQPNSHVWFPLHKLACSVFSVALIPLKPCRSLSGWHWNNFKLKGSHGNLAEACRWVYRLAQAAASGLYNNEELLSLSASSPNQDSRFRQLSDILSSRSVRTPTPSPILREVEQMIASRCIEVPLRIKRLDENKEKVLMDLETELNEHFIDLTHCIHISGRNESCLTLRGSPTSIKECVWCAIEPFIMRKQIELVVDETYIGIPTGTNSLIWFETNQNIIQHFFGVRKADEILSMSLCKNYMKVNRNLVYDTSLLKKAPNPYLPEGLNRKDALTVSFPPASLNTILEEKHNGNQGIILVPFTTDLVARVDLGTTMLTLHKANLCTIVRCKIEDYSETPSSSSYNGKKVITENILPVEINGRTIFRLTNIKFKNTGGEFNCAGTHSPEQMKSIIARGPPDQAYCHKYLTFNRRNYAEFVKLASEYCGYKENSPISEILQIYKGGISPTGSAPSCCRICSYSVEYPKDINGLLQKLNDLDSKLLHV